MADISSEAPDRSYRPVSNWAVAGLILGLLYAVLVVGILATGAIRGEPLFLPGWSLLVPVVALVASLVGWWNISNSEGALAGSKLAAAGLWVSVLAGGGYFAFTYVTGLALIQQANAFLLEKDKQAIAGSGFFPRLLEGRKNLTEYNQAFLLTLPASGRTGSNPASERDMIAIHDQGASTGEKIGGRLTQFRQHQLIQLLLRFPAEKIEITPQGVRSDQITIEPLAVHNWYHENKSYVVERYYRVSTPETIMEVLLPVQSTEPSKEGEARTWFLALPKATKRPVRTTKLGENIRELNASAKDVLERVLSEREKGSLKNAPVDGNWEPLIPKASDRERVKSLIESFLQGKPFEETPQVFEIKSDGPIDWEMAAGVLRIAMPREIYFEDKPAKSKFKVVGQFIVRSRFPIDLKDLGNSAIDWQVEKFIATAVKFAENP